MRRPILIAAAIAIMAGCSDNRPEPAYVFPDPVPTNADVRIAGNRIAAYPPSPADRVAIQQTLDPAVSSPNHPRHDVAVKLQGALRALDAYRDTGAITAPVTEAAVTTAINTR